MCAFIWLQLVGIDCFVLFSGFCCCIVLLCAFMRNNSVGWIRRGENLEGLGEGGGHDKNIFKFTHCFK